MKTAIRFLIVVLLVVPILAADQAGFAMWKSAELKERDTALSTKVGPDHSARETLADYGNNRFRMLYRDGDGFPFRARGIGVPTLAQVLGRYRDARIIIELKVNSVALARATVDTVRAAGAIERVCLGSFGRRVLCAVRALEPAMATSAAREEVRWALYRSWCRWPVSRPAYDGYQVPEWAGHTKVVSPRFIEAAHRAGLAVQVWTVDAEEDVRRLLGWGVDGLITDRPDVVVPIVRGWRLS